MYECKVLEAEFWDKDHESGETGPHYKVHYKGWKQSWDEWVPEDRLKKYTDENVRKQKALIDAQRARDAAEREAQKAGGGGGLDDGRRLGGAGGATGGPSTRGGAMGKSGKRGRDDDDDYTRRPEIKISIPDPLKVQLVDDWEAITKKNMLVPLPRVPNIDTILEEWNKYLQNETPDRRRIAAEVAAGLGVYFNKALGNNLLYRFERGQYAEQLKKIGDKPLTSVYGGEHLLRLFVNLPELLAHTSMDPESSHILRENMAQFLCWMDLNRRILFAKQYDVTSSAYQNANRA
ncbi:hypothetical protein ACM66B_000763 [Microbotryomycetes sp. NB124-2]